MTGAGQDEAGEVYLTACECVFEREYNPFDNPTGTLWQVVAADQVAEGAETAPLEQPDEPEATPAREGEEMVGTPWSGTIITRWTPVPSSLPGSSDFVVA